MRFYLLIAVLYLIFVAIGVVKMTTGARPAPDREPFTERPTNPDEKRYLQGRTLLLWCGLAVAFALLSIVFLGLPGAVLVTLFESIGLTRGLLEGDRAWPAAIVASLLFPPVFPCAVWLRQVVVNAGYLEWKAWVFPVVLLAWLVGMGLVLRALGQGGN